MKRLLKILFGLIVLLLLLAGGGIAYLFLAFPKVGPAKDIKIESTPELVARGNYLAHHVSGCINCHSNRDWSRFSGPVAPDSEGQGGEHFDFGKFGYMYAPNITPAGVGLMTDGELIRAITAGVRKDGSPLFALMPYENFGMADPEDIKAIVAYIRTLKPISHDPPPSHLGFPLNLIVRTMPKESQPGKRPDPSDAKAYGQYLVLLAACQKCHTPMDDKGHRLMDLNFAGGMEFTDIQGGIVRSANITPDPETGIGKWDKQAFIQRFRAYADPITMTAVKPGEFNTVMGWTMYAGMTDEDLGAIYEYLHSLPAVKHKVEHFTPTSKS